jgi:hypothetical protein
VAPLAAMAAAYSAHVRRVPFLAVGVVGTVVLFLALAFGTYRSTDMDFQELTAEDLKDTWSADQLADFVQIYASGPQMNAYLIEERGEARPYWGRTLVCSVLYPIPSIGKSFREGSGVSILNMLIYQDPDVVDQILAYDGELYINFHVPGVVAGYAVLGWVVWCFQARFRRATQAVESYAWMLLAVWVVFPGSLPVVAQMCIYFFWPIYVYFGLKRMKAAFGPARPNERRS